MGIIIPLLQVKKLRLIELKYVVQVLLAKKTTPRTPGDDPSM